MKYFYKKIDRNKNSNYLENELRQLQIYVYKTFIFIEFSGGINL